MAAFASSYIKTEASQVTRSADSASMTGANFSSWYNQAQGTMYAETRLIAGVSAALSVGGVVQIDNGSSTGNRYLFDFSNTTSIRVFSEPGSNSATVGSLTPVNGVKAAFAFSSAPMTLSANGSTVATASAVSNVTNSSRMTIGSIGGATWFTCGTIAKIAYYPIRATNAQLQALTS
jgi:hypothetical protein